MKNILDYLEHSAEKFAAKKAFEDLNSSCTYTELMTDAKAIGTALGRITSPRRPIPLFMEKSVATVAAFMGSVYAGCFYVLLDPQQPATRINQILTTLEASLIVVGRSYEKQFSALSFQGTVLYLEDLLQQPCEEELLTAIRRQSCDIDPLYGIFTSGSTGVPKGVVVSHRSVIDFMDYFTDLFSISCDDVIGNQAPFDFDVSVKDIYSTLKTGATMQIIPRQFFSFPTKLLDFLCEREVTTLIWAVSALCIITTLKGFHYKVPEKINKVLFSGEVMPIKHLNQWRKYLPDANYVNLYGPTEITCNCTYYKIEKEFSPGETLPIGVAFPNEKVFLLDEQDQLVSQPGGLGELCVSGTALSLGYFNNPEQTQKAFVLNPLNTNYPELIYRTGDLAYYDEDGQLYFASRKDFQIKHMGHRIELGEIEAALEGIEEINRVCCIFDERKSRIIACYDGAIEKKEITRRIGSTLPAYMIPNSFHCVDEMPLTKNGKIDRKELSSRYASS